MAFCIFLVLLRCGAVRCGWVWFDLVRFGLVQFLVWFGAVWFGSVGFGFVGFRFVFREWAMYVRSTLNGCKHDLDGSASRFYPEGADVASLMEHRVFVSRVWLCFFFVTSFAYALPGMIVGCQGYARGGIHV